MLEKCSYDYANKCDCSEDDKCGCTFPNNLAHNFDCDLDEEKKPQGLALSSDIVFTPQAPISYNSGKVTSEEDHA